MFFYIVPSTQELSPFFTKHPGCFIILKLLLSDQSDFTSLTTAKNCSIVGIVHCGISSLLLNISECYVFLFYFN